MGRSSMQDFGDELNTVYEYNTAFPTTLCNLISLNYTVAKLLVKLSTPRSIVI